MDLYNPYSLVQFEFVLTFFVDFDIYSFDPGSGVISATSFMNMALYFNMANTFPSSNINLIFACFRSIDGVSSATRSWPGIAFVL